MSIFSSSMQLQRGDVLLEALVGVLITGLIGAGLASVTARVLSSQHDAAVGALLVNEMRNVLQIQGVGLCDSANADSLTAMDGLPDALKEDVTLRVGTGACATPAPQQVTLGGASFTGLLPPEVTVEAVHGDSVYAVRTVAPFTPAKAP